MILTQLSHQMAYYNLQGAWTSLMMDYAGYVQSNLDEEIDYDEFNNEGLLHGISERRDEFIHTYSEVYKYKPYFTELILSIKNDHNKSFKDLTLDINSVTFRFIGIVDYKYPTYREMWESISRQIKNVDLGFESI